MNPNERHFLSPKRMYNKNSCKGFHFNFKIIIGNEKDTLICIDVVGYEIYWNTWVLLEEGKWRTRVGVLLEIGK